MQGGEYLDAEVLRVWWSVLDTHVRIEIKQHPAGLQAYLSERNPQWRLVGRVTLHLAENKRDPDHPFAFLATYIPNSNPSKAWSRSRASGSKSTATSWLRHSNTGKRSSKTPEKTA
jgi:hypothetical protein